MVTPPAPLLSLLILALAAAFATPAPPESSSQPPPTPAQASPPASPAASPPMTDAEAESIAPAIITRVEELRGLKFKRPVPVKVVDDAEARVHFEARLKRFWPEEQMKREQIAYEQLGLLPPRGDLVGSLFSLLEEQAGGYYDPETDTFYVLDDMPKSIAPMLMAHELTHALDDQHFDLDALFSRAKEDFDRSNVASAVVEGSGTLVMSLFVVGEMQAGRMAQSALEELAESEAGRGARLKASPSILQRGLLAPYLVGMAFMLRGDLSRLASGVPSADLDRALKNPPASFEQVLHSEKYWDASRADPPRSIPAIDLSGAFGAGWAPLAEGTLGELTIAIMAGSPDIDFQRADAANPSLWTNAAATGWGGDRWHLYRNGDRHATILMTLWDTPADAVEFEEAARKHAAGRTGQPVPHIARREAAVVLLAGETGDRAAAIAEKALAALVPGERAGSLVDGKGLEPSTSALRTRRSPS